jgi:SAM-dependent methyltransferase
MASARDKIVLHVGSGPPEPERLHESFRGEGWREVRLDVDASVRPDIVASITDMSAVGAESVDAVWSSHNLEHLFAHEVAPALAEFLRVLKPGGFALITLPDVHKVAELVVAGKLEEHVYTSPAGPVAPLDMLYGFRPSIERGNAYMAHHTGFNSATLAQKLRMAGFRDAQVESRDLNLWAFARKAPHDQAAETAGGRALPWTASEE